MAYKLEVAKGSLSLSSWMEKWVVITLLVLMALPFSRAYTVGYNWLTIDCGSTNERNDDSNVTSWKTDEQFIKTGQNKLLSANITLQEMNFLRFFPDRDKNCYNLPLQSQQKYLLRAGFYYGNYDGLSKPPTFDLEFDGNLWATVNTSLGEDPIFHEVFYRTKGERVSVCLIRTSDGEVPFISSLEATHLLEEFYRLMDNDTALYLRSKTHFGGNKLVGKPSSRREDSYNRIWKPRGIPNYHNISSNVPPEGSLYMAENCPPFAVLGHAIEAQNLSNPIFVSVDFPPQSQMSAYFVFYFWEPSLERQQNETRKVQVYIEGIKEKKVTEIPWSGECQVVSLYPVTLVGPSTVRISAAEGSNLPPILNAMEVYTTIAVSNTGRSHNYSSFFLLSVHLILCFLLPVFT